ncbi:hypothetical protein NEOC84_000838|uniref:AAA family ATPase n=1 Tax=Neochlamydia sp. AcF84 TaxID=2315858 RepID=UPI00140A3DEE|nr:AAA family ATPase [Neochlamydia sp. AcF84]NGY94935.1 hypothetical protein [Neochlamydia sp. AcF84]
MSLSTAKSSSPLSRSLYPKLEKIPSIYIRHKPNSSSLLYPNSISTLFHGSCISQQSISTFRHIRVTKVSTLESSPCRPIYPLIIKKRAFYSKKINRQFKIQERRIEEILKKTIGAYRLINVQKEVSGKSLEKTKEITQKAPQTSTSTDKPEKLKNMFLSEINWKNIKNIASVTGFGASCLALYQYYSFITKEEMEPIGLPKEILSSLKGLIHTQCLDGLNEALKDQETTIQKIAIVGEVGSGKTTLAKQYVEEYEKKTKEQQDSIGTVFFGDMKNMENFYYSYRKFAENLIGNISLDAEQSEVIAKVNKKIAQRPNWLFVIDNVDSKNYEKLQKFFPKSSKGKIILITEEELIGIIPFKMQANSISEEESLEIFHLNLGQDHWAFKQANTSKRELLRQLSYLPLAIKQAAIYFKYKYAQQAEPLDILVDSYVKDIKKFAQYSGENLYRMETKQLLKAIFSLNIQECETMKCPEGDSLSIIPFFSLYFVNQSLLQLWFKKKGKSELRRSILDQFEKYSLIVRDKQNGWKVHPFLQEVFREIAEKRGESPRQFLKDFLELLKKEYKLDMRFIDEYNPKQDLSYQIEPLLKLAEFYGLKADLEHYFTHLYNVVGNYYLQSNNFFEARQAFKKSLEITGIKFKEVAAKENEAKRKNIIVNEICNLSKNHKELPALCAQALHYLGRAHLRAGSLCKAKEYFNIALAIQKEISIYPNLYENPNPFDIIIFQRQGIGWALLEGGQEDLLKAENLYFELFNNKEFAPSGRQRDEFNEWYCNLQLGKVYLKLARMSPKVDKGKYYQKARERLETGNKEDGFEGALKMIQSDHIKAGEIYFALGRLYSNKDFNFNDPLTAQKCFKNALYFSKTDEGICAKSKYYLAKLYLKENHLDQALVAITESLHFYNKLGKGLTRILPKEAEKAKLLKNELVDRMLENKSIEKLMRLAASDA